MKCLNMLKKNGRRDAIESPYQKKEGMMPAGTLHRIPFRERSWLLNMMIGLFVLVTLIFMAIDITHEYQVALQ